jgi:hypothetical protein
MAWGMPTGRGVYVRQMGLPRALVYKQDAGAIGELDFGGGLG